MGRWYCCNDSFVTVSTLQEVLSEKVYILFFTRAKQRPVSALSNGVKKFHDCNGSEASKSLKAPHPLKPVHTKPEVEQPYRKDNSTISKVERAPRMKFNILGNSNSKKVPVVKNGNIDLQESPLMQINGNGKPAIHTEKSQKYVPLLANGNGFDKNKKADRVDLKNGQAYQSQNGNGHVQNVCSSEGNGTKNGVAINGLDHHNGDVSSHSNISGSKRTSHESCALLAQDAKSRAKVDELKEVLEKKASSVLRSCGWSDEVYNFMRSKKRLCTSEEGNTPSKKSLIADAKASFISTIPEKLKEDLIEKLQSFSKEKQHFAAS